MSASRMILYQQVIDFGVVSDLVAFYGVSFDDVEAVVYVDASGGHPGVAVDFFLHFEVEAVGFVVLENVVHFLVAVCGEADHVFVVINEDCAVIVEDVGIVGLFHCVFVYFFDVFRIGDVEHGYFHAVCRSGFFVGVHSDSEEEVVTVKVQVF